MKQHGPGADVYQDPSRCQERRTSCCDWASVAAGRSLTAGVRMRCRALNCLGPGSRRSAATPTSSCSGVGSRVEIRRWISCPAPWTAAAERPSRGCARRRRTARPRRRDAGERRRPRGRSGPGCSTSRSIDHLAGDREDQHRRDQVRAAALVLLRRVGRVAGPARRRRSPCARRRGRRRGRGRAARPAPAAVPSTATAALARRRVAAAAAGAARRWRAAAGEHRARSPAGPRTAAAPSGRRGGPAG